jgi:large subunit ribosomal protein L3
MKRLGLVAVKLGCSTVFDSLGVATPVTVLKVAHCVVSQIKNKLSDGYDAVQLSYDYEPVRESLISKPIASRLKKSDLPMLRYSKEFAFDIANNNVDMKIGKQISVDLFANTRKVDVTGQSKGRGFAGVMKRYGFKGLGASHGVSVSHRSPGSTGQRTDPGKVFKGKKMAGRYGFVTKTIQNLNVVKIDQANGLILVKGAVPGAKNSFVFVREVAKS